MGSIVGRLSAQTRLYRTVISTSLEPGQSSAVRGRKKRGRPRLMSQGTATRRDCLVLFYFNTLGMSARELARDLNIPEQTVRDRLKAAKSDLLGGPPRR